MDNVVVCEMLQVSTLACELRPVSLFLGNKLGLRYTCLTVDHDGMTM